MLLAKAPAKINLVLEVLGRRNGYHEIASVVQTVGLYDTLRFAPAEAISFECSEPMLKNENLAYRAALLLKRETRHGGGAHIELVKRIPWAMGLGGGSSDAACTLLCLNRLWDVHMSLPRLASLAAQLGADVPLFLYGGTTLIEGLGERVTKLPSLRATRFVLLIPPLPPVPAKTRQLYGKLTPNCFTTGSLTSEAVESIRRGRLVPPELLHNAFETVARDFFPGLRRYEAEFRKAGATNFHLSGSGPCLFTVVPTREEGAEMCSQLSRRGLWCRVVASSPGLQVSAM